MQHVVSALDFAPFTFRDVHASMLQLPVWPPTEIPSERCHTAMLAAGFVAFCLVNAQFDCAGCICVRRCKNVLM